MLLLHAKRLMTMLLVCAMVIGCLVGCAHEAEKESSEKSAKEAVVHPVTKNPITISILTQRHSNTTNNAKDIWFFQWLEYWLAKEYGYNVTIDIAQAGEPAQSLVPFQFCGF